MKVKQLLIISAIALLVFGLGFLLAPMWTMAFFDVDLGAGGGMMAQLVGGTFLGLAVINWRGSTYVVADDVRPLIWGNMVLNILGFVVIFLKILDGLGNWLAWLPAVLYLVLGLAYLYSLLDKRTYEEPTMRTKHA